MGRPKIQEPGIEYRIRFFYPSGAPKLDLTMRDTVYEYQAVAYWPNGLIHEVEHGSIDTLLGILRDIQEQRKHEHDSSAV